MVTIRQLLDQKGGEVCSIHPDSTVFDAVAKMAENEKVPSKKKGTDATAAPKPKHLRSPTSATGNCPGENGGADSNAPSRCAPVGYRA